MDKRRFVWAYALVVAAMLLLLGRLVQLQVRDHARYHTLSHKNHVRLQPDLPARGLILDRHGVVLADNQPAYSLVLVRENLSEPLETMLLRIQQVIDLSPKQLEHFHQNWRKARSFQHVVLKEHLTNEERDRFAVHQFAWSGCTLEARPSRMYPLGEAMAHVLGYVGKVNDEDALSTLPPFPGQRWLGRTGLEREYEHLLRGQPGYRAAETDAHGRPLRILEHVPAQSGAVLTLSIDADLQRYAFERLKGKKAALVAIEPATGDVLAMVSHPSFNPNAWVQGLDPQTYHTLQNDPEQPLFNRALKGRYPPASTLKPWVGLAALEEGLLDPEATLLDEGWFSLPGDTKRYRDWRPAGHGVVNLKRAIAESCDVFFYHLAHTMGIAPISRWMHAFHFGHTTGIDLPGEPSGLVPDPAWKRRVRHEAWYPGETLITAIGQGAFLSTPLQLAHATATMAHHGIGMTPRLVRSYRFNHSGDPPHEVLPSIQNTLGLKDLKHWNTILEAMEASIVWPQGTAHRIHRKEGPRVAGKTGTAQVFGIKEGEVYEAHKLAKHLRDHSLFIGMSPLPEPQIAVAVVVENQRGSSVIAGDVLHWYQHNRMNNPS